MKKMGIDDEYCFENFVVGNCNRFAVAASLAVAETPGFAYNPLIIYGKTGTGKTHLLNAIGVHIIERNPEANIMYMTAEELIKKITYSIKNDSDDDMYKMFDSIDVLMIDGVHYIAGKEAAQEEFFRIFDRMYLSHKQMILASDIDSGNIQELEGRILSRFDKGRGVEICTPDDAVKMGILNKYLDKLGFSLSASIREILIKGEVNAFEIQGLVNKLFLSVKLNNLSNHDISVNWTKEVLGIGT